MIINLRQLMTFNLLFVYLDSHKIKKILALSLNWKVNFKLFKKWVRIEVCM